MSDWLTTERSDLQELAGRLKQAAQLSATKLMGTAGLTRQTLDHWRSGRSTPDPDNVDRVGKALALYGQKLQELGNDLVRLARDEELTRQASRQAPPHPDELSLFEHRPPTSG
jgi:transcriptional regulator with XRE-family HTH domain